RSGDLEVVLDPYWIRGSSGTTHGSPYTYDSHIPLILMGPGVRAGQYAQRAAMNDIAPTLATLLGTAMPSGAMGRVLVEALAPEERTARRANERTARRANVGTARRAVPTLLAADAPQAVVGVLDDQQ